MNTQSELKFECPSCGQHIAASVDQSGVIGTCPTCQSEITVPKPLQLRSAVVGASASEASSRPVVWHCPACGKRNEHTLYHCVHCNTPRPASAVLPRVEEEYWVEREGDVKGPYPFEILVLMWERTELRMTDRVCKHGTDTWVEVTRLFKSLEHAERNQSTKSGNPPSFAGIVILTVLFPIVGLIAGIVWLSNPRYRGSGWAMLAISIVLIILYSIFLLH